MNHPTTRLITVCVIVLYLLPMSAATNEMMILKVRYIAVAGTDIEHGQGAIERNELEHCPITPVVWLVRVPEQSDPVEWNRRLDASVDRRSGCFVVERPSEEELKRVTAGELTFQR